jgi:hypothetical protein
MSHKKSKRSRFADYDLQRERAQQDAAAHTLNLQIESLTQDGLAKVIKRAFAKTEQKGAQK